MNKELLKLIVIDQEQEIQQSLSSNKYIERQKFEELISFLDSNLIKVVLGIRRCGKSTLCLGVGKFSSIIYINFDDERFLNIENIDLEILISIAEEQKPEARIIILDEIQNVVGWELFVNRLRRKEKNVIITGSNSNLLSHELASHLTGRFITLELFPFSFREYLDYSQLKLNIKKLTTKDRTRLFSLYIEYKNLGGFPEALKTQTATRYLQELYSSIISKDIVSRKKIKHIKAFKEVSLLLFSQIGQRFTYQSVKKTVQINSVNTVKNYIMYLQEAYLGFVLEPYSNKVKERISLPKKFYAIDLAMVDKVTGNLTKNEGSKLENVVYIELIRRGFEVYFILEPNFEVDFCIRQGRSITTLIQCCLTLKDEITKSREVKSLLLAAEKYKCDHLLILTEDEIDEIKIKNKKIQVLPIYDWLLKT